MKFARGTHIVIMAFVACIGLFALDYVKNPQLWHTVPVSAAEGAPRGPRLILWMNHMVCNTCLDDVRQALNGMAALDMANAKVPKLLSQQQAESAATMADYGNQIEIPIADLKTLDFVAVDRALRDRGLVAGRTEISGVEHFHLEATLDHLCCGACDRATTEHFSFLKAKGGSSGQLKWLDSVTVDRDHKVVNAFARYLEPGKTVDVNEFLAGLNDTGFAPRSLRAVVGEERSLPAAGQISHSDTSAHPHAGDTH